MRTVVGLLGLGAALAACSASSGDASLRAASVEEAAASIAGLPPPTYSVNGREVVVRLPYRTRDGYLWVDADPNAMTGPFMFTNLDVEPRGGPGRTDVAVFTYLAEGPGRATLRFALTPVAKGPAPELVRRGDVAARYEVAVTVN